MSNKYTYKPPCSKSALIEAYIEQRLSQHECADRFSVSQKVIFTAMKRYGIKARIAAKRNQTGNKNDSWKGDNVGKQAFHRRLYALYGKPSKCEVCGTTDINRSYDYANLTGNYHDIKDYKAMCRSCHWKFDGTIKNIVHMREEK